MKRPESDRVTDAPTRRRNDAPAYVAVPLVGRWGLMRTVQQTVAVLTACLLTSCATNRAVDVAATIGHVHSASGVVASIPPSIPFQPWGEDDWEYDYTVTFADTQGTSATVEWLWRVYIDRRGGQWASDDGFSAAILVAPGASNTYSSWVRGDVEPDLRGGVVVVSYRGHDAEGRSFSGRVSSILARPDE